MDVSKRLQDILRKNAEFEKEAPYNFCDRWCERCFHEKQVGCKFYHDEFEQKITCIAHGRTSDDPEITAEVMKRQLEDAEELLEKYAEENKKGKTSPTLTHDFETVAWYHTLLPAKLHRALCGFHEPAGEGDISLCDAVAQFEICKKAIKQSAKALRNISKGDNSLYSKIRPLLALLHNIFSRIRLLEEQI